MVEKGVGNGVGFFLGISGTMSFEIGLKEKGD
jgi:hypothetical protein